MRELKFRGWATSGSVGGFVYFDMREDNDFAFNEFCSSCEADNIEQYTGLKDKNGKEIYEGDIVQWRYDRIPNKCVVEYSVGQEAYYPYDTTMGFCFPESEDRYEVIGNIHENPELLENKK